MAKPRFKRLGLFYLIALGCIAISIIVSQFLIQTSINRQQDDAHVINVAGRQRMLSQKISKLALKIERAGDQVDQDILELKSALTLWKESHQSLWHGNAEPGFSGVNSDTINMMFEAIDPHFQAIYRNARSIVDSAISGQSREELVGNILAHESDFLIGMDRIVFQYDHEAQGKIRNLKAKEFYLFIISLTIILLELIFVFRPLAKSVRATVQDLVISEESSKKMANELSKLYEELGKSYQDLEAVNVQPESPSIYASMDDNGKFNFIAPAFTRAMEYEEKHPPGTLKELLIESGYKEDFGEGLIELLKEGKNWSGEIRLITEPGDFCWLETYLIPVKPTNEIKLIAHDITEFKEAKIRSRELNRERIEKSVKEQHYRSALILEGQEEERKRLSRELHDGVGQMLSAMKLLLESFTPSSKPMQMRMEDARSLMKSIIKEVRRVSFNLTPSSLEDFGLVPAVNKFCEEINAVTKSKVQFINETKFINRLDSHIETNLYRIIQEGVNNALKYSRATHITVRFSHTINSLNIQVEDDGKGFDYSRVENSGHFEKAGHGIFNMKERTDYIGGIFKLETALNQGTKILITLSLDKND